MIDKKRKSISTNNKDNENNEKKNNNDLDLFDLTDFFRFLKRASLYLLLGIFGIL